VDNEQVKKISRKALLKASIFFTLLLAALFVVHSSEVREILTPEALGRFLEASGFWAPLVFVLFYAACVCLLLPGSIPTLLGAAIFGAHWGFLYAWLGALAAGSAAFYMGRTLARDLAASLIGDTLRKYDNAICRKGFSTVLYLRLMNFPFSILSFGLSLTGVRFRDFFLGTALGVILGIYVLTFLGGTLKDIWISGNWHALLSYKVFLAIAFLLFSLLVPKIIKMVFGKN